MSFRRRPVLSASRCWCRWRSAVGQRRRYHARPQLQLAHSTSARRRKHQRGLRIDAGAAGCVRNGVFEQRAAGRAPEDRGCDTRSPLTLGGRQLSRCTHLPLGDRFGVRARDGGVVLKVRPELVTKACGREPDEGFPVLHCWLRIGSEFQQMTAGRRRQRMFPRTACCSLCRSLRALDVPVSGTRRLQGVCRGSPHRAMVDAPATQLGRLPAAVTASDAGLAHRQSVPTRRSCGLKTKPA